ncbi:MAG: hypothetical protein ABSH19_04505 [Opitutales bacterium]
MFKIITKPLGCIFSLIFSLLVLAVVVVLGGIVVIDHFAVPGAAALIKEKTGFEMTYASQDVNLFAGSIDLQGLTITNSNQFPTPGFVDLNQFTSAVELGSLVSDKVVVDTVVVDLKDVTIVKTSDGVYNAKVFADALKAMVPASQSAAAQQQPGASGSSKVPPFLIKSLTIKIGTVQYCDYSSGSGTPKVYNINYSRTFTDVTNLNALALALGKDFAGMGMEFMANMIVSSLTNLNTYVDLANGVLNGAGQVGGQILNVGQGAAKGAGSLINKINPF